MIKENSIAIIGSAIYFFVSAFLIIYCNPTPDSGDSALHYLSARYAWEMPHLFLDHWSKPLFTLTASPFAQFGFEGIVWFNVLIATLIVFFTSKIAKEQLQLKYYWIIPIILFGSPHYFLLSFSGLTEYLFAFLLIISLYLSFRGHYITSTIIISFLPFVRSEGLIVCGVFLGWLLVMNRLKYLPLLLTGHLTYGIIGLSHYSSVFWPITEVPYANLGSPYGKGDWIDFIHRLNFVVEKPILILFLIGVLALLWTQRKNKVLALVRSPFALIFFLFFSYFLAHSLFWHFGIFNSMGLPRVLNAIVPLFSLLTLYSFEAIDQVLHSKKIKMVVSSSLLIIILVYPFTERPQGRVYSNEMFYVAENALIDSEIKPKISVRGIDSRLFYNHPYISVALGLNHFDETKHQEITKERLHLIGPDDFIIWDSWFSRVEGMVNRDAMLSALAADQKGYQILSTKPGQKNFEFIFYNPMH